MLGQWALLAAATQQPGLMHFLEKDTSSPDQFSSITCKTRLSTWCSDEEGPPHSDHDSPSLPSNRIPTCLPNQETDYRLIQMHFLLPSGADRPIKAPALSVSAGPKGLNTYAFVRAKGSSWMKKKKSARHAAGVVWCGVVVVVVVVRTMCR